MNIINKIKEECEDKDLKMVWEINLLLFITLILMLIFT